MYVCSMCNIEMMSGAGICCTCAYKIVEKANERAKGSSWLKVIPSPAVEKSIEKTTQGVNVDNINSPKHYTSHPSGIECIQITRHFPFAVGNVIKYLWREGLKSSSKEDALKAKWYLDDWLIKHHGCTEEELKTGVHK